MDPTSTRNFAIDLDYFDELDSSSKVQNKNTSSLPAFPPMNVKSYLCGEWINTQTPVNKAVSQARLPSKSSGAVTVSAPHEFNPGLMDTAVSPFALHTSPKIIPRPADWLIEEEARGTEARGTEDRADHQYGVGFAQSMTGSVDRRRRDSPKSGVNSRKDSNASARPITIPVSSQRINTNSITPSFMKAEGSPRIVAGASPGNSPDNRSGSGSEPTSVASSIEGSPATTPRDQDAGEKISRGRRLKRKVTKSASDLAALVGEKLKNLTGNAAKISGDSESPTIQRSPRLKFSCQDLVDSEVDLEDPVFFDIYRNAAKLNFMNPWEKDGAGVLDSYGKLKGNSEELKSTFLRDLGNSHYFIRTVQGTEPFKTPSEFTEWIDEGKSNGLGMIVSNIANQNLGRFINCVLFRREISPGIFDSVLKLADGRSLCPKTSGKASYTLSKTPNGRVTIDYTRFVTQELNRGLRMTAEILDGTNKTFQVSAGAKLEIRVCITVEPDGEWHIANPRITASGWREAD